jgi:hypothetical protein
MPKKLLLLALAPISLFAAESPLPAKIEFNRDVRPILSDNCYYCHGNDPKHREADLRLDLRDEAVKAKAFLPGNAKDSELVSRILTEDEDDLMPPPDSHKKLTQRQKDILKKWIEQGAAYQQHWAYEKPLKAAIPAGVNPIDHLVQKRLTEIGLKPSPKADARTLMRRLSFDLTGLPPQKSEITHLKSEIDNLLASPHFGERMAIAWLDQVRFADTIGYHSDNPHNVWPYRDYVIQSFNSNKPFDRFTIEQIAGDLMPDATQETRVASAFNRLILSTEEGGAQAKDYEQRMLTDRVRAIGNAWMGQTTGCAQCHDHKFDPITTRDFYTLGAFFADIKEPLIGRREAGMIVLDAEGEKKQADIAKRLGALQADFAKPRPELATAQAAWEAKALEATTANSLWQPLKLLTASAAKKNVTLKADKDGIVRGVIDKKREERKQNDGTETYTITTKLPKGTTGIRLDALKEKSPGIGLASNGNFALSEVALSIGNKNRQEKLPIAHASATFEQKNFPAKNTIDGIADQKLNGWAVLGATGADQSLYLELAQPHADAGAVVTFTLSFAHDGNHEIANLRLNTTTAAAPIRAPAIALPAKEIADILKAPAGKRTATQKQKLAEAYKQIAPELAALRTQLSTTEKEKADFEAAAPKCIVSVSDTTKRTVRILPRGDWMNESGEVVKAALPSYLPKPKIEGRDLTRLDLAQWLVSKENPLTARNVMNRLWKQFFGTGISKIPATRWTGNGVCEFNDPNP